MKVFQSVFNNNLWSEPLPNNGDAQLVLVYGSETHLIPGSAMSDVCQAFDSAQIVGCTTSGEIIEDALYDNSLTISAITFSDACIHVESASIDDFTSEEALCRSIFQKIPKTSLRHILVISDGQKVNGTELVEGFQAILPKNVTLSGGLAGDGANFNQTTVLHNDKAETGLIAVVCFYGSGLKLGFGSYGGWQAFGPEREVTKSRKNVVYEIDGKPALELYKSFLGEYAQDLPGSALLYPLSMKDSNSGQAVVRTILSINEEDNSMLFAGNMPEGAICQLMHANTEQLVDGAEKAVQAASRGLETTKPSLAMLVSCVGRRLVMSQRVEEELEIVREALPDSCKISGFYSYGEISPLHGLLKCGLHNQTMTVTLIGEE